jgi:hypothetical protein
MAKEFMGTLVFLYEASEKAKSLQGGLRAVQRICEEDDAQITDLTRMPTSGRLAVRVCVESRCRFESDKEAISWGEKLKSRLSTEQPSGGRVEPCYVGRITEREKKMIAETMGAFDKPYRAFLDAQRKKGATKARE